MLREGGGSFVADNFAPKRGRGRPRKVQPDVNGLPLPLDAELTNVRGLIVYSCPRCESEWKMTGICYSEMICRRCKIRMTIRTEL